MPGSKTKEKQLVEDIHAETPTKEIIEEIEPKKAQKAPKSKTQAQPIDDESSGLTAVVIGGTGAVGRFLVQSLLVADEWKRVLVIGRRSGIGKFYNESPKLVEIIGSLDGMCSNSHPAFQAVEKYGPHAAFCCLGTTYEEGGSSKKSFKLVDYTYVTDFAWMTRHLHVPHFQLVSSMGSSARSPFLYPRTKGKSEDYIKSLVFPMLLIYRPGLLGRPEPRSDEKCFGHFSSALSTEFFGKVMERVALGLLKAEPVSSTSNKESLFGGDSKFKQTWKNAKIYSYAKKNQIPKTVQATDVLVAQ